MKASSSFHRPTTWAPGFEQISEMLVKTLHAQEPAIPPPVQQLESAKPQHSPPMAGGAKGLKRRWMEQHLVEQERKAKQVNPWLVRFEQACLTMLHSQKAAGAFQVTGTKMKNKRRY